MKYLIFGDIHGKDLKKLEKEVLVENPNSLVFLGDFDSVKSIRQFMDIEKDFLKNGKEVIKVPGNHDYALLKNQEIYSGTLFVKGKPIYQLHKELLKDKKAYSYVSELVNSDFIVRGFLDKEKLGKKYPFVVVHGAYTDHSGDLSEDPRNMEILWNRLLTKDDFHYNFLALEGKKEKIMIRGHDHFQNYAKKDSFGEDNMLALKGHKYALFEDKTHIINPGSFFYGDFATIDTSTGKPIVEYHKSM